MMKMLLVMILKRMMNRIRVDKKAFAVLILQQLCMSICQNFFAALCQMLLFFQHASAVSEGWSVCGIFGFHDSLLRVG